MAEITLKMASQLIGYTNADVTIPVPDDITPEEVARLHWDWNVRFVLEQEKVANEPLTEKQEAAVSKAATEVLTEKLPATTVSSEATHEKAADKSASRVAEEKTEEAPPWEGKPEATAKKPWENKPKFDNLPDLFA